MPGSKDVGKNIRELKTSNKRKAPSKRRSHEQIIAISLSQAREAGARIPRQRGR